MSEIKVLAPLLAVLADLIAWLKAEEVAGVVIGGLAASLLGRPRLTRAVWVEVGGIRVPLPRPEDLIILKAVAHRPQDLADPCCRRWSTPPLSTC